MYLWPGTGDDANQASYTDLAAKCPICQQKKLFRIYLTKRIESTGRSMFLSGVEARTSCICGGVERGKNAQIFKYQEKQEIGMNISDGACDLPPPDRVDSKGKTLPVIETSRK